MKKLITFVLYYLIMLNGLYANHYAATDISYRHLKNQEYEVNVVFYRDCMGIPLPYMDLFIQNDSFYVYKKMSTRVKIEDILYNCKSKVCSPSNSTITTNGFEAHYFRDTIDFNSGVYKKFISKKYCQINFAVNTCCRPSIINSDPIYIEAMLDLCYAKTNAVSTSSFFNTIKPVFPLNQTFNYSFRTLDTYPGDSISYELVKGKEGYNNESNYYGGSIPVGPFCLPAGVFNCKPIPGTMPPRGLYFNEQTGNMVFCPVVGNSSNVIVCRINTFRKDSGKYKLVGYSKRDMQLSVLNASPNNVPIIDTYREVYNIKAREKFCTDIVLKDFKTSSQNLSDTIKLKTIVSPKYGQLSLLDSNAREKTLHYCWNPSDSDYIKKKEDNIFISAYDDGCIYGSDLSTSIYFKVMAPDSLTNITVRTFYDRNKNGKRDVGEPYRSAPVLTDYNNKKLTAFQTDSVGFLNIKPWFGQYNISITRNQFIYQTGKDTLLNAGFDKTHTVTIGFNYNQGIRGRVFEDVDNDCAFDANIDLPLSGVKILSHNKNAAAISDENGEYLLNGSTGSYLLGIDSKGPYENYCNNNLNTTIVKDSQFINLHFPLKRKILFSDISIRLKPQTHQRNNTFITQSILIENKGNSGANNFYIKLLPSRKLNKFSGTPTYSGDTMKWQISTAAAGSSILNFSHYLSADSFIKGDRITYQLWADYKDSLPANNYYELTETIGDTICCKTEKTAYALPSYYPNDKTVTYRLNFIPSANTTRAYITDVIDDSRFDLRTIQILSTGYTSAYINKNTLMAEFKQNTFINNVEFIYSIDFKTPITDSFTVYNKALCNVDRQPLIATNTTATNIVSPIAYDNLTKTSWCGKDILQLGFTAFYKPASDNHFKVFLSDSLGSFSQPSLLLDTSAFATHNRLKIKLPAPYKSNTYQLKVTGTNPAIEALTYIANPAIIIDPLPKINFKTNLSNGRLCKNDSIMLKGSEAFKYQFLRNSLLMGGFAIDSFYSEKLQGDWNYQIKFMSQKGCINTSPLINATTLPLPKVTLSANDLIICDGDLLELTFGGAFSYSLYRNLNELVAAGITGSTFKFTPSLNQSQYNMLGADIMGCKDTSNKVNILVLPLPAQPVISKIGKSLKSSYTSNNQWYNLAGKIDTAINQSFYPPADGKYYVKYTDNNGCEKSSDVFDFDKTAIKTILNPSAFSIYPNPASEQLYILNYNKFNYSFYLYDAFGRLILRDISDEITRNLNIEQLSAGNYILRINSGGQDFNFRVMVLK